MTSPAGAPPHLQLRGIVLAIEHPGVVHFGEVVILGGQPEHGDRRNALRAERFGQLYRAERFVDGVCRAGEQAHLLARHHGDRARLGKLAKRRAVRILLA